MSRATNDYIKKNWKDFKEVELSLRSDGNYIVTGIQDTTNEFGFQQRSDGFRRLTSFLLLMSTEIEQKKDNKKIILIDEPEIGLHPSSSKDLKNRLIEIGKSNLVIYSTHSISMIDTENIENNLIVSKEKESTKIKVAKEDGVSSAENIYQAIGYSIYEELKKNNILLEGYTDKKIIKSFISKDEKWKDFGICYTSGVKNIENITSILDLVSRKYFILSDGDKTVIEKRKKMDHLKDIWFTYKDLGSEAITIEDFFNKIFFLKIIEEVFEIKEIAKKEYQKIEKEFLENNRIHFIKNNLSKVAKNKTNDIIKEIKQQCIIEFKEKDLDQEKIEKVLESFFEKIEELNEK